MRRTVVECGLLVLWQLSFHQSVASHTPVGFCWARKDAIGLWGKRPLTQPLPGGEGICCIHPASPWGTCRFSRSGGLSDLVSMRSRHSGHRLRAAVSAKTAIRHHWWWLGTEWWGIRDERCGCRRALGEKIFIPSTYGLVPQLAFLLVEGTAGACRQRPKLSE